MLSLREALPEKQSLKGGVATWATAFENRKVNREKKNKKKEGSGGEDMIEMSEMTVTRSGLGQREKRGREGQLSDKLGHNPSLFVFFYYVTNLTFMVRKCEKRYTLYFSNRIESLINHYH
jgi:hypothetical protein